MFEDQLFYLFLLFNYNYYSEVVMSIEQPMKYTCKFKYAFRTYWWMDVEQKLFLGDWLFQKIIFMRDGVSL